MDKDLITDYLYEVPRGWQKQFVEDGWEFLFIRRNSIFPRLLRPLAFYYVRYSTDWRYKKVKFCATRILFCGLFGSMWATGVLPGKQYHDLSSTGKPDRF